MADNVHADINAGKNRTSVQIARSVGPYDWCGFPNESGFCLTNNSARSVCGQPGNSQMIRINITLSAELFAMIDIIQIYGYRRDDDNRPLLLQYSCGLTAPYYNFLFPLRDPFDKQQDAKTYRAEIRYDKILPIQPGQHPLSRAKMQTIYSEKFDIPAGVDVKSGNECAICLEPADIADDSAYLSECPTCFTQNVYSTTPGQTDYCADCRDIVRDFVNIPAKSNHSHARYVGGC